MDILGIFVRRFRRIKLKYQLILIAILGFLAPTLLFFSITLNHYSRSQMDEIIKTAETSLAKNAALVEQNALVCVTVSQSYLNNLRLISSLDDLRRCKHSRDILELLEFKQTEVVSNERLINSNPILNQVRVYLDSDTVPEMMPFLYGRQRARRQAWYREGEPPAAGWYFDFTDNLFETNSWYNQPHLVSLLSPYYSLSGEYIGQLEVVSGMDLLFPGLYQNDEENWRGFLTGDGRLYCQEDAPWQPNIQAVFSRPGSSDTSWYSIEKRGGSTYILCYHGFSSLPGGLVTATRLDRALLAVRDTQILLSIALIVLGVCFCLLISKTIRLVLKQLYQVLESIEFADGANVDIAESKRDEIALLDSGIRSMTERIQSLVSESVHRERMVRSAEIRALQNQINAHFIYNVLESIKMMAEIQGECDISDAIAALGKLLRYNMSWPSASVRVEEELAYIRNYIALTRLRREDEIHLSIHLPPELLKHPIPKMSLQPIVENAINHGMADLCRDASIEIIGEARTIGGKPAFQIHITDSGCGMSPQALEQVRRHLAGLGDLPKAGGHGIGLKNVQDRLRLLFDEPCGLEIQSEQGVYTKVTITFPY